MKNLLLYYFVGAALSYLLCGCSGQEGKSSQHIGLIQTTDTLSFPLPDGIALYSDYIFLHTDSTGHEYLLYRDRPRNPQILVYDLENPSSDPKVIKFYREGPNGVGAQSVGFFVRSWDEIYVPNTVREICVLDCCGVLKRKIMVGDDSARDKSIWTQSTGSQPFIFIDDKLFCYQSPNKFKGEKELTESPVDLIFDLNDGSFVPSTFCYPSELMIPSDQIQKNGLVPYAERCLSCDKIVYSFWYSHYLYEYDIRTGEVKKKEAKSRYLPDEKGINPYNRLNNGEADGIKEICEMAYYRHIYYDEYRKVFYRFAYPTNTCEIEASHLQNYFRMGRNTASIMVLDEDLNVISETLLPEDRFNTGTTFINKDGLWISCNHMLNPGLDEDHLQFVRFELKSEN